MKHFLVGTFMLVALGVAYSQPEVQQSHIMANVPEGGAFEKVLERDLLDFMKAQGIREATRVQFNLLREAPTQSGTAYPKFYAWARVYAAGAIVAQGAVRVAAVQKSRFDVTHFHDVAAIRSNPDGLKAIFPAALVPAIIQQAKAL